MSRILKYRESLEKFIKNKSCIINNIFMMDKKDINAIIFDILNKNDNIYSILMMTIMNNQNKKKKITSQGYFMASAIEFLNVIIYMIDDITYKTKMGIDNYYKTINILIQLAHKSICQNMDSIKMCVNNEMTNNIYMIVLNLFNEIISFDKILNDNNIITTNKKLNNDVLVWYIKTNNISDKNYKKFLEIEENNLMDIFYKKYGLLCQFAICIGWTTSGDISNIEKVKYMSNHFVTMYKIYKDFINIEQDLKTENNYTLNYVINYGLQYSYEKFMKNKQKFIEIAMYLDTYTSTIKELISSIDSQMDKVLEKTSPDLKSNFSGFTE